MINDDSILSYQMSCVVIFSITILCLVVTYLIFSVIGLINYYLNDEYYLCKKSHLWAYSMVSIILSYKVKDILNNLNFVDRFIINNTNVKNDVINTLNIFIKNDNNKDNLILIIKILICISMFIWGTIEFFGVTCVNNLNKTILYKITFILWIIFSISTCLIISLCIYYINLKYFYSIQQTTINDIELNTQNTRCLYDNK